MLGTGHFSEVWCARVRTGGAQVAVKVVKKGWADGKHAACSEVAVLRSAGAHPHIVRLLDTFEDINAYYIVLELVEGGELFDALLREPAGAFDEACAAELAAQLASALCHLHARGICHRDLKLENILLEDAGEHASSGPRLKLTDFGLARLTDLPTINTHPHSGTDLSSPCGTPAYAAPELLGGFGSALGCVAGAAGPEAGAASGYGIAVDMWALGVVLFTLLLGEQPFGGESAGELIASIRGGHASLPTGSARWLRLSPEARGLILSLLSAEQTDRPTARQVLEHPWLQSSPAAAEARARAAADRPSRRAGWRALARLSARLSVSVEAAGTALLARVAHGVTGGRGVAQTTAGDQSPAEEHSRERPHAPAQEQVESLPDDDSIGDLEWDAEDTAVAQDAAASRLGRTDE